jgi:hypothetical protein
MTKRVALGVFVCVTALWWTVSGGAGCYYYDDDDCEVKIETNALPPGIVGVEYRFNLDSKCGGDDWFIAEGLLPPGISLQSDGDLVGTPVVAGSFIFTVGIIDYFDYDEAFKGFQLTVGTLGGLSGPTPSPTVGP